MTKNQKEEEPDEALDRDINEDNEVISSNISDRVREGSLRKRQSLESSTTTLTSTLTDDLDDFSPPHPHP